LTETNACTSNSGSRVRGSIRFALFVFMQFFLVGALLYESPGGNQVDGLPPAQHLVVGGERGGRRGELTRSVGFKK